MRFFSGILVHLVATLTGCVYIIFTVESDCFLNLCLTTVSLQYGNYEVNKNTQFMQPPITGLPSSMSIDIYTLSSLCSQWQ